MGDIDQLVTSSLQVGQQPQPVSTLHGWVLCETGNVSVTDLVGKGISTW